MVVFEAEDICKRLRLALLFCRSGRSLSPAKVNCMYTFGVWQGQGTWHATPCQRRSLIHDRSRLESLSESSEHARVDLLFALWTPFLVDNHL